MNYCTVWHLFWGYYRSGESSRWVISFGTGLTLSQWVGSHQLEVDWSSFLITLVRPLGLLSHLLSGVRTYRLSTYCNIFLQHGDRSDRWWLVGVVLPLPKGYEYYPSNWLGLDNHPWTRNPGCWQGLSCSTEEISMHFVKFGFKLLVWNTSQFVSDFSNPPNWCCLKTSGETNSSVSRILEHVQLNIWLFLEGAEFSDPNLSIYLASEWIAHQPTDTTSVWATTQTSWSVEVPHAML
jgi:hypothetical protein